MNTCPSIHLPVRILSIHLPPKCDQIIFCRLSPLQTNLYAQVLGSQGLQKLLAKNNAKLDSAALVVIGHLRKLCNHPWLIHPDFQKESSPVKDTVTDTADGAVGGGGGGGGGNVSSELLESGRSIFGAEYLRENTATRFSGKLVVVEQLLEAAINRKEGDKFVIVSNFTSALDIIGPIN